MKKILMMLVLMTSLMSGVWAANSSQVTNAKADSIALAIADSTKKADMDYLATAIAKALEQNQENTESGYVKSDFRVLMEESEDILVPIFICCILPLGIVISVLLYKHHKTKDRNRVILSAIEHGQDISAFLAAEQETTMQNSNDQIYRKGIKNVCIGAALIIVLFIIATEIA